LALGSGRSKNKHEPNNSGHGNTLRFDNQNGAFFMALLPFCRGTTASQFAKACGWRSTTTDDIGAGLGFGAPYRLYHLFVWRIVSTGGTCNARERSLEH
jgi:glycerol-3-phosphate acyltransferase PlsY